ncbi:MAG: PAS domain-containing sensor histidine kinase, partial [Alphaproteobacteria bacterium]
VFSWRVGALLTTTAVASVLGVAVLTGLMTSLQFGAAAPSLSLVLGFIAVLFRRIDALDIRVIMQNLALLKRSGYMRLIVDNSSDAILTIDNNDRIRSANVAAEAMFDQPASALLGCGIGEVVELSEGPDDLQDADRLPQPKVFGRHGSLRPGIGRSAVGRRFDVEVSIGTMNLRDEHVSIVTVRDVSERIKAEQEIREADRRLRTAINTLEGGFALFERSGALTLSNKMWQTVFGTAERSTSTENNYGLMLSKLGSLKRLAIHDDELEIWLDMRKTAFRRGQDRFEMPLADGTWYLVTVAPADRDRIAAIFADITPLKSREAEVLAARDDAERANQTKSEFLANMSHELRTPLNAILGFSELMQKEVFGPLGADSYREYTVDIHNSGAHLLELINEILDLSKIEAGLFVLNDESGDLSSLVAAAERMIQSKAHEAHVALEIDDLSALPDIVVDRAAFKRVLINILSNGVKFTSEGGKVRLSADVRSTGDLAIRITDTGCGIAAELLNIILKPFTQVDSAFSRSHEGAGLGLSIVKGILDQHEAAVTIESALGEGTTVTVVLPAGRVLAPSGADNIAPAANGSLATA